ncbi:hypothetical protein P4H67_08960 [Paenibacillus lautus]|uniref:SPRY domain-containing protein n=1 Tax=Paenibacillus lautus TaxID=1401 RepID=UPI002DB58255|nr:SPRY domain-containing protein [Paenibacillus lautus]MEC0306885.1 hypothetical protein [Paenibacillus lautus]
MPIVNVRLNQNDSFNNVNLSNNDLSLTATSFAIRSTLGKTRGKWYWEVKLDSGNNSLLIGITSKLFPINGGTTTGSIGDALYIRAFFGQTGTIHPENLLYGTVLAVGDVIGVAMDLDIGTLEFFINGGSMGVSHNNLRLLGEVFPFFKSNTIGNKKITVNFGSSPFSYSVPNGYLPYAFYSDNKFLILDNNKFCSIRMADLNKNIIPPLKSYAGSAGIVNASNLNSNVWTAFNGDKSDLGWLIDLRNESKNQWLSYKFPTPKVVGKYTMTYSFDATGGPAPKSWTFEGSNDAINWIVLDTKTDETNWTQYSTREYRINNENAYMYYRIYVSDNNGGLYQIYISELEMMETYSKIIELNNQVVNEEDFLKHGMDQNDFVDLQREFKVRSFLDHNGTKLGSGTMFKQKVDTQKVFFKTVRIE